MYPTEEMFRAYQTRLPEQALIGAQECVGGECSISNNRSVAHACSLLAIDTHGPAPTHPSARQCTRQSSRAGCVLLIVGIAAFFGGFDHLSRKHYNASYLSSALSNAESRVERENMRSRHAFVSMVRCPSDAAESAVCGELLFRRALGAASRRFPYAALGIY